MIKEIEVGGVKHSITLADDMIGHGLSGVSGRVDVLLCETIPTNYNAYMTGISFDTGGRGLVLNKHTIASSLSGSGLTVVDGKLTLSGGSSVNLASTGALFKVYDGICISGPDLAGSGLFSETNFSQIGVNICSGRGLCFLNAGVDVSVNNRFQSVAIKIVNRASGLRLFFNSNGELDVTQD